MKKILLIVLAVVVWSGVALAAPGLRQITRRGNYVTDPQNNPVTIFTSTPTIVTPQGAVVYNMTINATAANAELDLYDSSDGTRSIDPVWEVKCATSGDSRSVDLSGAPLNFQKGITATAVNGFGFISYE